MLSERRKVSHYDLHATGEGTLGSHLGWPRSPCGRAAASRGTVTSSSSVRASHAAPDIPLQVIRSGLLVSPITGGRVNQDAKPAVLEPKGHGEIELVGTDAQGTS